MRALSQRLWLAVVGALFRLQPDDTVPVLSTVELSAMFDLGFRSKQLIRAAPTFRTNKPWYDAIMYAVKKTGVTTGTDQAGANPGGGPTRAASGDDSEEMHIGEVRALVRCREDDFAVVCDFDPVPAEPGCPFAERECDRLEWAGSAARGGVIRGVPMSMVLRLVHVVPDFKDLAARKGLQAAPAGPSSPWADLHAMRYFVNDFYPW